MYITLTNNHQGCASLQGIRHYIIMIGENLLSVRLDIKSVLEVRPQNVVYILNHHCRTWSILLLLYTGHRKGYRVIITCLWLVACTLNDHTLSPKCNLGSPPNADCVTFDGRLLQVADTGLAYTRIGKM